MTGKNPLPLLIAKNIKTTFSSERFSCDFKNKNMSKGIFQVE